MAADSSKVFRRVEEDTPDGRATHYMECKPNSIKRIVRQLARPKWESRPKIRPRTPLVRLPRLHREHSQRTGGLPGGLRQITPATTRGQMVLPQRQKGEMLITAGIDGRGPEWHSACSLLRSPIQKNWAYTTRATPAPKTVPPILKYGSRYSSSSTCERNSGAPSCAGH